uniref:Uncharacterized protein n=1 Tax=Polytomella parva TaxID=51329 RepID=A0A7S0VDG6_9CHLO|mmetsp:Transcript_4471/g.8006  ORF Transcript_4471/g.8006 Transcript_4471/m.8006 type:complete len:480 (+) Transcript_4471:595-2034(+)
MMPWKPSRLMRPANRSLMVTSHGSRPAAKAAADISRSPLLPSSRMMATLDFLTEVVEEEEEEEEEENDDDDNRANNDNKKPSKKDKKKTNNNSSNVLLPPPPKLTKEAMNELSNHERRLLRIQESISEMERVSMSEKDWFLRGEASASRRPLNSALEIDMDFETTMKPAPQPTEEATQDIESLVRRRIADKRFDDPIRMVATSAPDRQRKVLELNDNKSAVGLGELYEGEFNKEKAKAKAAAAGEAYEDAVDQKTAALRRECRGLLKAAVAKLDALARFHYAPKPVIEELTVKSIEASAIAMEEAVPTAVSSAALQTPAEAFTQDRGNRGAPKAEAELTHEERRRRRAKKKEQGKVAKKDAAKPAPMLQGRRSEAKAKEMAADRAKKFGRRKHAALGKPMVAASRQVTVVEGAGQKTHGKTQFGNSGAVFAKLAQEQQERKANGGVLLPSQKKQKIGGGGKGSGGDGEGVAKSGAAFKL